MIANRSKVSLVLALAAVAGSAGFARAQNQCLISFDDTFALSNVYAQARTHFGFETKFNTSTNRYEQCDSAADDWQNCWVYRERCNSSTFYVNAWPWSSANHFHMFFDSPVLQNPTCHCDPGDGYGDGFGMSGGPGHCITNSCPIWGEATRKSIYPHTSDDWAFIWMEQNGDKTQHTFTMKDITIGGTKSVELWYEKTDGTTWGWDELPPGYYVLYATDAKAVWINTAGSAASGPPEIVDYIIVPQS